MLIYWWEQQKRGRGEVTCQRPQGSLALEAEDSTPGSLAPAIASPRPRWVSFSWRHSSCPSLPTVAAHCPLWDDPGVLQVEGDPSSGLLRHWVAMPYMDEGWVRAGMWSTEWVSPWFLRGAWLILAPGSLGKWVCWKRGLSAVCRNGDGGGMARERFDIIATICPRRVGMVFSFCTRTLETASGN